MNEWLVAAVLVAALLVSSLAGSPLTAAVLRLAARSGDAGRPRHAAGEVTGPGPLTPDASSPAAPLPDEGEERQGRHEAPAPDGDDDGGGDGPTGERARDALRGGTWIGVLERLAVTGCLLAGYPSGIAFVIAIKGLGRYPELKENPGASERFVIGTLASMVWAAGIGVLAREVLW